MSKNILIFILKIFAQLTLWRYRPKVVGITGSVGKTSTKEAAFAVLKNKFRVRQNYKNYNNEIGVPLSIMGLETGGRSLFHWVKVFIKGILQIIYTKDYPEILILEMGADKIGDIDYLTSFIKCDVGVIVAITEIPAHIEFFRTPEQAAMEKSCLTISLSPRGWAVLNFDDERVKAMAKTTKARIFSFSANPESQTNLKISNLEIHSDNLEEARMSFKVNYQGSSVPIRLEKALGEHQIYPALAAISVGLVFDMNLVEISQAFKDYEQIGGRMRLLKGIKNSWIIDDTYNAAPAAMLGALESLKKLEGRKIAVLGDMLELGAYTEKAHRQVGAKVAEAADWLLAVGERAIFIADEAKKKGLPTDKVFYYVSSEDAGKALQDILKTGDIVLVKGSQFMRMEKIVKEVMAEPEKAEELLTRQEEAWLKK